MTGNATEINNRNIKTQKDFNTGGNGMYCILIIVFIVMQIGN